MRRPYARKESKFARRTVLFGSVNPREYLVDDTGNRRFWTLEAVSLDARHDIDMQQLWAQVYHMWRGGETHYLTPEEHEMLNAINDDHSVICPIEERILSAFDWDAPAERWGWMSATEVLIESGLDRPTRGDSTKAGAVLARLNHGQRRRSGTRGRQLMVPPMRVTAFQK